MPRAARLYLVPAAVLLGMLAWLGATTRGFILLDTYSVLAGTGLASDCLHHGTLTSCGGDVNQYALLQYLPSFVFHETGFALEAAANGLVALNGIASLGLLVLVVWVAGRHAGRAAAALSAAVLLASPLVWYAHAGFGEPLAAVAVTGFTASLLLRGPPAVTGLTMVFAGVSKETAVPFLLGFALAVALIRGRRDDIRRAEIAAVVTGGVIAVALNAGFNEFRYGTLGNDVYSSSQYRVGAAQGANNLLALFFSPTAGLLWMWPAVLAVVVPLLAVGLKRRRLFEPAVAILAVSAVIVLVTAAWYAPFGGTTWGPRLLLPWLPAVLILCIAAYPRALTDGIARALATRAAFLLTSAALLVTGLPQIEATVDSSRYPRAFPGLNGDARELALRPYGSDQLCPRPASIEREPDHYFICERHQIWNKGIVPATAYSQLGRPRNLIFGLVWSAAMIGLLAFARQGLRRQPPARA